MRLRVSLFGGRAAPDHWTLNAFRRRHAKGLNDLFTRVVELARASGLGRLGHVAIDSTRIAAMLHAIVWTRQAFARNGHVFDATFAAAEAVQRGGPERGCGHGIGCEAIERWSARGRNSRAAGTVAEIGSEETFADRSGQPISRDAASTMHAGGESGLFDCQRRRRQRASLASFGESARITKPVLATYTTFSVVNICVADS